MQRTAKGERRNKMENDGITRLYYYHDHPYMVQEAWPQHTGWEDKDWTYGQEAKAKYDSADFICVTVREADSLETTNRLVNVFKNLLGIKVAPPKRIRGKHYWRVRIPGESWDKRFIVNRIGFGYEDFANLAKVLEQRTDKKGLTILI